TLAYRFSGAVKLCRREKARGWTIKISRRWAVVGAVGVGRVARKLPAESVVEGDVRAHPPGILEIQSEGLLRLARDQRSVVIVLMAGLVDRPVAGNGGNPACQHGIDRQRIRQIDGSYQRQRGRCDH